MTKNPKQGLKFDDLFAKLVENDETGGTGRVWVGNNTYVEWLREDYIENFDGAEGFIAMTYHSTKVVNFLDADTVQLFHGGYSTRSTQARLDWALLPLGFRLSTVNKKWKVYSIKTGGYRDYTPGMIVERGAF